MDGTTDVLVFGIVVLARLLVPLFIFRFPFPAIVASLLVDAVDKAVLSAFTDLNLENYQSYDKALDVYYLALAYIATIRNWSNLYAFRVGRFLWYFRLVGSTLFELTGLRFMLLVFPNTFEYFFIWIEAIRSRWSTARLTRASILGAAAVIWIGIKLPQEFWIHVLMLDLTDMIKENILGASPETGWGTAIGDNLWVFPVLLVGGMAIVYLARKVNERLPDPDRPLSFDANSHGDPYLVFTVPPKSARHWREGLLEKFVLVALLVIIYGQMLPNVEASVRDLVIGVAVVIIANAFISHWLAMRGTQWRSVVTEFFALSAINVGISLAWVQLLPGRGDAVSFWALLFFNLMLTLIVVLYDRYRPIYDLRMRAQTDPAAYDAGTGDDRTAGS